MDEQDRAKAQALMDEVHAMDATRALIGYLMEPDCQKKSATMGRIWLAAYILAEGQGKSEEYIKGLAAVWAEIPPHYRELTPLALLEAGRNLSEHMVNAGVWLALDFMENGATVGELKQSIENGDAHINYGDLLRSWMERNDDGVVLGEDNFQLVGRATPWRKADPDAGDEA